MRHRRSAVNRRPKRWRISCSHCTSSGPAGATTSTRCARRRAISSQAISPASIVLPSPTPSASSRPRPWQFQRPHQRNKLVRLDPHATRLCQQQVSRPKHLLQQACLMQQPPGGQRARCIRPKIRTKQLDRFRRMQDIPLQAGQITPGTAQMQQCLRPERRHLKHVPGKPAHADAASHSEFFAHPDTAGSRRRRNVAAEG